MNSPERIVTWSCRGRMPWRSLLAAGEHVLSQALSSGLAHMVTCRGAGEALVLGLYGSAPVGEEVQVERRVTGGDPARLGEGDCYVAAAWPETSLAAAAAVAREAAERLGARTWGVTVAEKAALVELLGGECGDALPGARRRVRGGVLWRQLLTRYEELFASPSWRLYRYRRGSAEASVARGLFYARLSVEITDGYITGWWLDSNMMAAPPVEIYSILASMKGAPFHELSLANLEIAIEKRLETYGLEKSDLVELLRSLHEMVGETIYGSDT